jgi:hypothetical protein
MSLREDCKSTDVLVGVVGKTSSINVLNYFLHFICWDRNLLFMLVGWFICFLILQFGQVSSPLLVRHHDFLSLQFIIHFACEVKKESLLNRVFNLRNDLPAVDLEIICGALLNAVSVANLG